MSAEPSEMKRTVMFADIVDSTGLYEEFGDEQAQAILNHCMDVMEEVADQCGGAVRKRIGDEVLCTFETPTQAVRAAARMHTRVVAGSVDGLFPRPMRLRIGFEHGDVIERDGELFGSSVHTAARLAALAKAGQILTSKETLERVETEACPPQRYFDKVLLKGQKDEREVIELLWSQGSTVVSSRAGLARPEGRIQTIELRSGEHVIRVDAAMGSVDIGRDEICDLRVEGEAVSRLHAKIALERGRARVEDVSANGSSIQPEKGRLRELHRDSAPLEGRGVLRLGLHCDDAEAAFVHYACTENGE